MKPSSSQRAKGSSRRSSRRTMRASLASMASQATSRTTRDLAAVIHAELQQTETAAFAGQPFIQQHLEVAAALEAGRGSVSAILQGRHGGIQMANHPSS